MGMLKSCVKDIALPDIGTIYFAIVELYASREVGHYGLKAPYEGK